MAGPILVSAYDVAHQPASPRVEIVQAIEENQPSFVPLDSGGYEVLWNERALVAGPIQPSAAPDWSPEPYHAVLDAWPSQVSLLAVSYDAPNMGIEQQVEAALELARRYPRHDAGFSD